MSTRLKGCDISEFNNVVDFSKLKNEVDFIYIRASWGFNHEDKKFKEYVNQAIKYDIPFGLYYYSYALNVKEAKDEVNYFIELIKPYKDKMDYPACIDMEDCDGFKFENGKLDKEVLSDIVFTACEELAKNLIVPIVYANLDYFKNKLNEEKLSKYFKWLAWWNVDESKIDSSRYVMWQKTSKGTLSGISGNCDLDVSYIDFRKVKLYTENVKKINFIKSKTRLEDLTLQYLSCYKFGRNLINKLYLALQRTDKEKRKENVKLYEMLNYIKRFVGLESRTIHFIENYLYSEDLIKILYNSLTIERN